MTPRFVLMLSIFATLTALAVWGWQEAVSTSEARRAAEDSIAECQSLKETIQRLRSKQLKTAEGMVQQDSLFGKLSKAIQSIGLEGNALVALTPKPPETLGSSGYVRNDIELQLRGMTQVQLLAFLKAVYSEELPLMASQIRLDAAENGASVAEMRSDEVWDVKLLLTYFVRSGKSSR